MIKTKSVFLIAITLFINHSILKGSEFKKLIPVTNNIICLYFEDGYIKHPGLGQIPWIDGEAFLFLIDSAKAANFLTYSVSSIFDSEYTNAVNPVLIGRKTKGIDFLDKETPGKKYNYRIPGHCIYLKFEKPFKNNIQYTVHFPGLATNQDTVQFIYNESRNVSQAVHVNQIGYSTEARLKYGYVYHWMGEMGALKLDLTTPKSFHLVRIPDNEIVYTGTLQLLRALDNLQPTALFYQNDFCMSSVYRCDFSEYNIPGTYKLIAEGVGSSYPFELGVNGYHDAYKTVLSGLFHHRSGVDRTSKYSQWIKPVEHKPGVNDFAIRYSKVKLMDGGNNFNGLVSNATGEIFPTAKGKWMPKNNEDWGWGGYFDAGDYDRQSGHLAAAEYLLFAYEFRPQNFLDNELNIPESGNGIPDILDEAKWGIDCYRRLQGPTGGICGGMEENEHPLPGENSVTDSRPWYVYAEESKTSFKLAAVNVQLAFCLENAGVVSESDSLISQAVRVYNWAKKARDVSRTKNEWQRAAIWLYKYTGDAQYHTDFLQLYNSGTRDNFAIFVYANMNGLAKDEFIASTIRKNIQTNADVIISQGKNHPASLISPAKSGWNTLNFLSNVHKLIFAYQLTKDQKYLDYVYTTCDYNLGSNPENLVFVTGLGEKHINQVFNTDSWFDGIDESIPGIVPYGLATEFVEDNKTAVWRPYQTYTSCYPDYTKWPSGELWFENRYLINCNEYTIGETLAPAIGAYSFVAGEQFSKLQVRNVQGVNLNLNSITIKQDEIKKINIAIAPYYAENKETEWISTDTLICKINSMGVIKGCNPGNAKVIVFTSEGNFSDTCIVNVTAITSVNKFDVPDIQINIFPSPAKEIINIDIKKALPVENCSLRIFSSNGQLIYNQLVEGNLQNQRIKISTTENNIKPGIYLVKFTNDMDEFVTKKISVI